MAKANTISTKSKKLADTDAFKNIPVRFLPLSATIQK